MKLVLNTAIPDHFVSLFNEDGSLIWNRQCPPDQKASFWLPKTFQELFDSKNWNSISDLLIIDGPGSFTGLRVGFSVARTISYIKKISAKKITSLEALALGASTESGLILANVDGQRNRVISQLFEKRGTNNIVAINEPELQKIEAFEKNIPKQSLLVGFISNTNFSTHAPKISQQGQKMTALRLNPNEFFPYAEFKKALSWKSLNPNYFRKSSPEEKRDNQ